MRGLLATPLEDSAGIVWKIHPGFPLGAMALVHGECPFRARMKWRRWDRALCLACVQLGSPTRIRTEATLRVAAHDRRHSSRRALPTERHVTVGRVLLARTHERSAPTRETEAGSAIVIARAATSAGASEPCPHRSTWAVSAHRNFFESQYEQLAVHQSRTRVRPVDARGGA